MNALRILGFVAAGIVVACGTAPADSPNSSPELTVASGPAAITSPRENGPSGEGSVVRQVASKLGLGSERDEMVAFTREALAIEAKRNSLIGYFASLSEKAGGLAAAYQVGDFFLRGIPERDPLIRADGQVMVWPAPLEGMLSLRSELLLLDAPQALEPVKDSLVHAYNTEIDLAIRQAYSFGEGRGPRASLVKPLVTKNNLDALRARAEQFKRPSMSYNSYISGVDSYWGRTQLFRQQIYARWAAILQEQGVNAAKEGFTELVDQ